MLPNWQHLKWLILSYFLGAHTEWVHLLVNHQSSSAECYNGDLQLSGTNCVSDAYVEKGPKYSSYNSQRCFKNVWLLNLGFELTLP